MAEPDSIDHELSATDHNVHREWNPDLDPALWIEPGDTVNFDCRDSWDGLVDAETTIADFEDLGRSGGMPLTGPVGVRGAEPGDVLEINLLEIDHADWGWTVFRPGDQEFGLLADEFPEWGFHYWELAPDEAVGHFVDGIEIPLDPFPGTIGVAPGETGSHSTTPPRHVGGNMDTKYLTAGSTLKLPVETEGALFSIGDGHATQGDGEVCGGAIETEITVTAELSLRTDETIQRPQYHIEEPPRSLVTGPAYATMGISSDLKTAAKQAVSDLVAHLHEHRGLTREQAYILCSVAADLRINEIVDEPNWAVSAVISEELFPE
jgi:acetamidase/formamidase